MSKTKETEIQESVDKAVELETAFAEKFQKFIAEQKKAEAQIVEVWDEIKHAMIDNDVKSIKGDWGSITVTERLSWSTDPTVLPEKFFKQVVDTKKLSDTFKLEGEAPEGAMPKYTKYLMKRIK